jgi:hypothetical protein
MAGGIKWWVWAYATGYWGMMVLGICPFPFGQRHRQGRCGTLSPLKTAHT